MEPIMDKCSQGHNLQRKVTALIPVQKKKNRRLKMFHWKCPDLVLMSLGVLDSLEADGHDSDGWRWQVFDHRDQITPQSKSLHLTPADCLAVEL